MMPGCLNRVVLAVPYTSSDPARVIVVPGEVAPLAPGAHYAAGVPIVVRRAATAAEALSLASAWRPALVVAAARPPDMPITEFCSALYERVRAADSVAPAARWVRDAAGAAAAPRPASSLTAGLTVLLVSESLSGAEHLPTGSGYAHLLAPVDGLLLLGTLAGLLAPPEAAAARVPLRVLASLEGLSAGAEGGEPLLVNTLEVGEHTLLVEASRPLVVGAAGAVKFFVPGGAGRLALQVRVHHLLDALRHHYLLDLVGVGAAERRKLTAYVRRLEAQR